MRLAAFSDIHGNPIALDAVLADIEAKGGVDGYLVVGDLVAQGYDPVGVLEKLTVLPNARFVRGNTERYVWSRATPYDGSPERITARITAVQSHAWTNGVLSAAGWIAWLKSLPLEVRFTLPDGTRVLCVHARPGRDEGVHIDPVVGDAALAELLADCQADLVLVGHSHWPSQRRVAGMHAVNVSSVSNPLAPDLRAAYAIIEANDTGYEVTLHRSPTTSTPSSTRFVPVISSPIPRGSKPGSKASVCRPGSSPVVLSLLLSEPLVRMPHRPLLVNIGP